MVKKDKEKFKVYNNVFDNYTLKLIEKLRSQHVFDELSSEISLGKEANVFKAKLMNEILAVKIYRVRNCNFNKMFDYIGQDVRFVGISKNKRRAIFEWVRREYKNMLLAYKVGVPVPRPIAYKDYVIVMEFIGDNGNAAKQLKNHFPDNPVVFFEKIIENYKKLVLDAKIVHGDLSEFNILNYHDTPVFIDFSQGTDVSSRIGIELLKRDLQKIDNFFKRMIDINMEQIYNDIISELKKRKIIF